MPVLEITTEQQARDLARRLQRPGRQQPVIVVSTAAGRSQPYVDVAQIERDTRGLCEVAQLPTGPVSWAYSRELPDGCQVYGGASRVYPVDLGWVHDVRRAPLRFAYSVAEGDRVTGQLISDALTAAAHAGTGHGPASPRRAGARVVRGTVHGTIGTRGLVDVGRMLPATVWPELVVPGVPIERLLRKGMTVTGTLDLQAHRLDLSGAVRTADEALAAYPPGSRLLATVASVSRAELQVRLFPGAQCPATVATGEHPTDLLSILTVGEVVGVELTGPVGPDLAAVLLDDIDLTELTAPAVLPDGPPWLVPPTPPPPETEPAEDADDELGLLPAAGLSGSDVGLALQVEHEALRARLAQAERRIARLETERAQARSRLRKTQAELRSAERDRDTARAGLLPRGAFATEEEWLRFGARHAWATRTTANDKRDHPWRDFAVGPDFLDSWNALEGIAPDKVVEVVADVASGRADTMPVYEMHQLRSGPGGDDPPVTRSSGETCWRVALQRNTPAARRLHFWRRHDGTVELSSVRLHDDFRP